MHHLWWSSWVCLENKAEIKCFLNSWTVGYSVSRQWGWIECFWKKTPTAFSSENWISVSGGVFCMCFFLLLFGDFFFVVWKKVLCPQPFSWEKHFKRCCKLFICLHLSSSVLSTRRSWSLNLDWFDCLHLINHHFLVFIFILIGSTPANPGAELLFCSKPRSKLVICSVFCSILGIFPLSLVLLSWLSSLAQCESNFEVNAAGDRVWLCFRKKSLNLGERKQT